MRQRVAGRVGSTRRAVGGWAAGGHAQPGAPNELRRAAAPPSYHHMCCATRRASVSQRLPSACSALTFVLLMPSSSWMYTGRYESWMSVAREHSIWGRRARSGSVRCVTHINCCIFCKNLKLGACHNVAVSAGACVRGGSTQHAARSPPALCPGRPAHTWPTASASSLLLSCGSDNGRNSEEIRCRAAGAATLGAPGWSSTGCAAAAACVRVARRGGACCCALGRCQETRCLRGREGGREGGGRARGGPRARQRSAGPRARGCVLLCWCCTVLHSAVRLRRRGRAAAHAVLDTPRRRRARTRALRWRRRCCARWAMAVP